MGVNGLKGEVKLVRPYLEEEEYWEIINGLANNTLADNFTLSSLREYYNTRDESSLTENAEKVILHWFGIRY